MRSRKQLLRNSGTSKTFAVHPKVFIFLDKRSGTRRFEVKAGADGRMPVEQAVDLLAVHCLVRKQSPSDFMITVGASENLIESLGSRAKKIIQACHFGTSAVRLSHRQEEVLHAILQGLTNKEIAAKLLVSESTIKFHVSLLLQKFEVQNRWELTRKATDLVSAQVTSGHEDSVSRFNSNQSVSPPNVRSTHPVLPVQPMPTNLAARRPGLRTLA
ncbi:MAG TPA: LuxR C-terminal-related transcriptional regulator [Candidatus Acidoferrales bacterium]|nr:LuxR C-terminal-related transcriptional regulator [Candidatus Acidoferrales bacterium]